MQTALIRMRCWVIRRLTHVQAAWHSDDISPTLSNTEAVWKLKQTRNLAENNLFSWLCVKGFQWNFIHMITLKCTCSRHNFCAGQFGLCRVMALGFGKYGSKLFVAWTTCTVLMGFSMKLHTNIHHPMYLCYIDFLSGSLQSYGPWIWQIRVWNVCGLNYLYSFNGTFNETSNQYSPFNVLLV